MSVRSRSRSPIRGNDDKKSDRKHRYLFIGNLPKDWRFYHIKEFLVEQYLTDLDVIEDMGHIYMLKDSIHQPKGECLVEFDSEEYCQKALKALQGGECEGKKLIVMTETGSRYKYPTIKKDRNDGEPRYLFIGNLPVKWRYQHIKEFLVEHYLTDLDVIADMGHIYILKDNIDQGQGECLIAFESVVSCQKALKALQGAECEGKKLTSKIDTGTLLPIPKAKVPKAKTKRFQEAQKPSTNQYKPPNQGSQLTDSEDTDPPKMYGLSKEFLDCLGIKPPLDSRVFVGNLAPEVTETKLREVFTLAGHVVSAKKYKNWGKVLFDHPVEAVQAISMFNGQTLYNSQMIVHIDRDKYRHLLPEGLERVGKGLGFAGEPLRSVRMTYELQPLQQLLEHELAKLQQPAAQNPMAMLSVNTNQAQNNPLLTLLQLLQDKGDGGASANWAALQNPALNPNVFTNVQSQQTPPTSRFDIPPSALALAQNPLATINAMANAQNPLATINAMANAQNPLALNQMANLQSVLANLQNNGQTQNAQSQQAPRSRFDIPPSALSIAPNAATNASTSGGNQAWAAQNDWSNYQSTAQSHLSGYNNTAQSQPGGYNNTAQSQPGGYNNTAQSQPGGYNNTAQSQPGGYNNTAQSQPGGYNNTAQSQRGGYNNTAQSQPSGYNNSGYGNYPHNPDEFDVQRLSDLNKLEDKMKSSDMLLFQNLPPSVTSKALVNKMREVGELLFAEMTGQDRAVVRFQDPRDAERCVKLYDGSKVDGQVISVKIF